MHPTTFLLLLKGLYFKWKSWSLEFFCFVFITPVFPEHSPAQGLQQRLGFLGTERVNAIVRRVSLDLRGLIFCDKLLVSILFGLLSFLSVFALIIVGKRAAWLYWRGGKGETSGEQFRQAIFLPSTLASKQRNLVSYHKHSDHIPGRWPILSLPCISGQKWHIDYCLPTKKSGYLSGIIMVKLFFFFYTKTEETRREQAGEKGG